MSYYKDFVRDLPTRCLDILKRSERQSPDLQVTQLLMVASVGLVIPRERLKDRIKAMAPVFNPNQQVKADAVNHPDVQAFQGLAQSLHVLQGQRLRESILWPLIEESVRYAKMIRPTGIELSANEHIPEDIAVWHFLDIIRNGLAHGNIFIKGPGESHIASLTFGQTEKSKQGTDHYEFVTLSVQDFHQLLLAWFALLSDEQFTVGVLPTVEAAD